MRRVIIALAIGALVVGGAAIASAQTGDDQTADTARPERLHEPGTLLQDALDELVAENPSFTQEDADAVVAKLEEKRAEFEALREERQAEAEEMRALMQEFLADGVIDADELAQLPEWHPLAQLDPQDEVLADGVIDADELAQLAPGPRGHGDGPRGGGFGPGHMGPGHMGSGPMGFGSAGPDA